MKRICSIVFVLTLAVIAMAMPSQAATITSLQASVTKTAAFDGAVADVSAASGDVTFKIQVSALSGTNATARLCLEDAAAATFPASPTPANVSWCIQVIGTTTSAADRVFSVHSRDLKDTIAVAWGQTNGKVRISLTAISGTSPSVTYSAWYEQ